MCDPSKPCCGFQSWDDFYTPQFQPGIRSVASLDDDSVIVNAGEAALYRLAQNISILAQGTSVIFWTMTLWYRIAPVQSTKPSLVRSVTTLGHSPVKCTIPCKPRIIQETFDNETWSQGHGNPLVPTIWPQLIARRSSAQCITFYQGG
jgi:hypothetical protein